MPIKLADQLKPAPNINSNGEFYILQCPRMDTTDIPKPKDMSTCAVVGKYIDVEFKEGTNKGRRPQKNYVGSNKVKVRSMLHTKVDYKPKKLEFDNKCKYLGVGRTYEPIFKAKHEQKFDDARKEKTEYIESVENNDSKEIDDHKKGFQHSHKFRIFISQPNHSIIDQYFAGTANKNVNETFKRWQPRQPILTNFTKQIDGIKVEKSFQQRIDGSGSVETPLKYLRVKDAVAKLFQEKRQLYEPKSGNSSAEAQQFFAEHLKYRKGAKKNGFHNIYHRDEVFKDHIFYDDDDAEGDYKNEGAEKEEI